METPGGGVPAGPGGPGRGVDGVGGLRLSVLPATVFTDPRAHVFVATQCGAATRRRRPLGYLFSARSGGTGYDAV